MPLQTNSEAHIQLHIASAEQAKMLNIALEVFGELIVCYLQHDTHSKGFLTREGRERGVGMSGGGRGAYGLHMSRCSAGMGRHSKTDRLQRAEVQGLHRNSAPAAISLFNAVA